MKIEEINELADKRFEEFKEELFLKFKHIENNSIWKKYEPIIKEAYKTGFIDGMLEAKELGINHSFFENSF